EGGGEVRVQVDRAVWIAPRSVADRVRLEALELAHRGPQRRAPGRDVVADPGHLPADHVGLAASSADPDVPPRPLASVHRTLLDDEDAGAGGRDQVAEKWPTPADDGRRRGARRPISPVISTWWAGRD